MRPSVTLESFEADEGTVLTSKYGQGRQPMGWSGPLISQTLISRYASLNSFLNVTPKQKQCWLPSYSLPKLVLKLTIQIDLQVPIPPVPNNGEVAVSKYSLYPQQGCAVKRLWFIYCQQCQLLSKGLLNGMHSELIIHGNLLFRVDCI